MCDAITLGTIATSLLATGSAVKGTFAAGHDRMLATQAQAKQAADAKALASRTRTAQDQETLAGRKKDYASRRVGVEPVGSGASSSLFSPRSFFS